MFVKILILQFNTRKQGLPDAKSLIGVQELVFTVSLIAVHDYFNEREGKPIGSSRIWQGEGERTHQHSQETGGIEKCI